MSLSNVKINDSWTLFLDRDGTINRRLEDSYVQAWDQFEFLPGVLSAMPVFSQLFAQIVVVTNQQGIGKMLMTHGDLEVIHHRMLLEMHAHGGRVDQIYYCPDLAIENPPCRKPNPGMALQAQQDFPEIRFKKSMMVGDALSDMAFGRSMGMHTCLIDPDVHGVQASTHEWIDYRIESLLTLAEALWQVNAPL